MAELTLQERKQAYITLVQEEYKPVKYKWWKQTRINYYFTKDLARDNPKKINRTGPVEFKKGKFDAYFLAVLLVAAVLATIFGDRIIGFFAFLLLIIFFALALPRILDKKVRIRITRTGIWLEESANEISWENVLITCVKVVSKGEDSSSSTFIIHFYDPILDNFFKVERILEGIQANHLSATIEYYKNEFIPTY